MATIVELDGIGPTVGEGVFLAPTAVLVGDVRIGDRANIWFGASMDSDGLGPVPAVQPAIHDREPRARHRRRADRLTEKGEALCLRC
jgi:carbonic anhydrase/acetyltransferase-like protein (isoleucine patch superfamily)